MNDSERAELVNFIVSTWPTGPKGHVWTDVLGELDYGPALGAYRRLRLESERPPSVARFVATYRLFHPTEREVPNSRPFDPYYDEPIPFSDPRAQAAFSRGYLQGQYELWGLSKGKLGIEPPAGWEAPDA
jgi:hypothetical protein